MVTVVSRSSHSPDAIVVGGGMIGLALAWRLRADGLEPLVLDAGEPGAWHVAAGMLGPVSEADFGEDALLALGLESARRYPDFAARLGVELRDRGTLAVARDDDEAEELERLLTLRRRLGLPVERLLPSRARRVEPALAPTVRLALEVPGDHAVDPRALHAALARDATIRRARVVAVHDGAVTLASPVGPDRADRPAGTAAPHRAVPPASAPADAAAVAHGETLEAAHVVLAAGAWSGDLIERGMPPVRPVGGQVLRLRDPRGPGLVDRVIRTPRGGYLVPRGDGAYVLGATVEERGWRIAPTAGGAFELLRDLGEVVPGLSELELEATLAGARPGTPDNLPLIGRPPGFERTILATGHYRSGVLLAPLTADLVAGLIAGRDDDAELLASVDPARFATAHDLAGVAKGAGR